MQKHNTIVKAMLIALFFVWNILLIFHTNQKEIIQAGNYQIW